MAAGGQVSIVMMVSFIKRRHELMFTVGLLCVLLVAGNLARQLEANDDFDEDS